MNIGSSDKGGLLRAPMSAIVFDIFVIVVVLLALCAVSEAQFRRIGYISGTSDSVNQGPYVEALREGLRDLGYIEGKHFAIEYRGAEGKL